MTAIADMNDLAVRVETPCRVDLAGGTLDISPLSTFEGPVVTVNAAIDLLCRADLRVRTDGKVVIRSEDRGHEVRYDSITEMQESEAKTPLDLIIGALRYWEPPVGFTLTTHTEAPPGSGLGASSSLLVAVLGALTTMFGGRYGEQEEANDFVLVGRASTIEARHLKVPTGTQDHFAALYGGPLAVRYDVDGAFPEKLALSASMRDFLNRNLLIFYTGVAHDSASPNWNIVKAYVENTGDVRSRLRGIAKIANEMVAALKDDDQDRVMKLVNDEWELRKGLAEGVTTPELDALVAAVREAGAIAVKACGAAGGGSLICLAPPQARKAITAAAEDKGAERILSRIATTGIRIMQLGPDNTLKPVESSGLGDSTAPATLASAGAEASASDEAAADAAPGPEAAPAAEAAPGDSEAAEGEMADG